jgi:RND family efflux transporter MFP subunit
MSRKKQSTTTLMLGTLMLVVLAAASGCRPAPPPPEEIRPVRTIVVQPSPVTANNTYAGEVRPRYESSLGFRVAGKIAARLVNVGDSVKAGQVLARLDPKDLSLSEASSRALTSAQDAQLEVEKADLDRYKKLLDAGFIGGSEYERQLTKFKAAKAQLDSLQAQLRVASNQTAYAELRADHDGTITAIQAEAGQVVAAGQAVAMLAQSGDKEVAANVPEDQVQRIQVGQPAVVSLWSAGGKTYDGVVRELSSSADASTRTYAVRVTLPKTADSVRLGMTASVRFAIDGLPDAIQLPLTAMTEQAGIPGVWVVDPAASTVSFHSVTTSAVVGNQVLIGAGITPGDVVVTAGAPLLRAGQKVRLLDAAVASR